jgi:UDP-GlcNAc:undecaprenyl-phosphate GlcNAc-1-phosphate transferase
MSPVVSLTIPLVTAFLASVALTLVTRNVSTRLRFVDRPDKRHKNHSSPVALGGGVAILAAMLVGLLATSIVMWLKGGQPILPADMVVFFGLILACLFICIVGLIDDRFQLRARYKLAGQVVAASVLIFSGHFVATPNRQSQPLAGDIAPDHVADHSTDPRIPSAKTVIAGIDLFDMRIQFGLLAIPVTFLWLLGIINSINLLDGIDGLATSIGVVLCVSLAALALMRDQHIEAAISLVAAGALLGFLRFNIAPATIFLGDSGSLLIGMVVGGLSVIMLFKEAVATTLAVPIALWAIPGFDSAAAIVRRKLTARSLFAPDRSHFHHSLIARGWTARRTMAFITLLSAITSGSALVSLWLGNDWVAYLTVTGVLVSLVVTKTFGHAEWDLVLRRMQGKIGRLADRLKNKRGKQIHEIQTQLAGSRQWKTLWSGLTESAERYNLTRIELTLDLPAFQETFYARWQCSDSARSRDETSWRVETPLVADDYMAGKLVVEGISATESNINHIAAVVDFLEPIEQKIQEIIEVLARSSSLESPELAESLAT